MRQLWFSFALVALACHRPSQPDRCAAAAASFGEEVPLVRYSPPKGCQLSILSEYDQPSGHLGKKVFVIRSEDSFQSRYGCVDPQGAPIPSGIDFQRYRLVVMLNEHKLSERHELRSIREDGQLTRVVYSVERCEGLTAKYQVALDELLLPVSSSQVSSHRCEPTPTGPCGAL